MGVGMMRLNTNLKIILDGKPYTINIKKYVHGAWRQVSNILYNKTV
jgi:hypothetical protein